MPLALFLLSLLPSLTYPLICLSFAYSLNQKRSEVNRLVQNKASQPYFQAYGQPDRLIWRYYNWKKYFIPVLLNMTVVFCAALAFQLRQQVFAVDPSPALALLSKLPPTSLAGFMGAYIWGHYDLLRRHAQIDLPPAPLYQQWLRLLIGLAFGYVAGATLQHPLDILVAFGIGAFPLDSIRNYLESEVSKRIGLNQAARSAEPPTLYRLQGMTDDIVDRLEEEGITSAEHMALANPIRLLLKTNLEWTLILDLIDQAILYLYVGDKIADLRTIAIRGALEMSQIRWYDSGSDPARMAEGDAMKKSIAAKLGENETSITNLIDTLYDDPQVGFVYSMWLEAFPEDASADQDSK